MQKQATEKQDFLEKLSHCLSKIESGFIVSSVLVLVFFSTFQIIARNVFNYGIPGLDILLRIVVLWVAFFGASLATARRRHIAIDAIGNFLSQRNKTYASIVTNLAAILVCFLLMSASWDFMSSEKKVSSELVWGMKNWWFQTILPFGFGLICFRFFLNFLSDLKSVCCENQIKDEKK